MKNLLSILPLLLLASCGKPTKSTQVCDTLLLRIVSNRLHNDSVANAIQINSIKAQIDTLKAAARDNHKKIMIHDSLVNSRQFKRDRIGKAAAAGGGILRGFFGI